MAEDKKTYVGLKVTGVVIFGILLALFQFGFAVHNGGANAQTTIVLSETLSEEKSAQFDNHLGSKLVARCRTERSEDPCTLWEISDTVFIRADTYEGATWIIIDSSPRNLLLFGSPKFRASHVQAEESIVSYFGDLVFSVEKYLR
jgi:hypothetical protein